MDVGQAITEAMQDGRIRDLCRLGWYRHHNWRVIEQRRSLAYAVKRGMITEGQAAHMRSKMTW